MSNFKRYYQDNNIVFVTIVTYDRKPILIENIDLLRESLKKIKYDFNIIAGVVLPDHLHLLISTKKSENFSKIISSFKAYFSMRLSKNYTQTLEQLNRREKGVWQRKYYDHVIRSEDDLDRHLDYIHFNSMKHFQIAPKNWKFSSFEKYVKKGIYCNDWCNFEDKNKISMLDLE
ncbi:MAG: transposase [Candidatus Gastranaerophilales bacterium]|nr:transposase [Candidatus Gastranaerophilales bacterium]